MTYDEAKALEIIQRHNLNPTTLRVWRHRGKIPNKYAEEKERVYLPDVLTEQAIATAVDKYGDELRRLLETRTFRPEQKDGYYAKCFMSLCKECEYYLKTGKLSK